MISELVAAWKTLITDEIDSVKVKSMESCTVLAEKLSKEEVNSIFMELIISADKDKKSWRVRYAQAEVLPALIGYLGIFFKK